MPKVKLWKNGGKEDRFIERLISEGSFTKNTKPSILKQKFPTIFDGFSNNVIRNHCNEIKRRNGLHLLAPGGLNDVDENDDEDAPEEVDLPREKEEVSNDEHSTAKHSPNETQINFQNYPTVCEIFKDPSTEMDMVLVAVNLPGGAQNVKCEVNNDGTSITIKFNWSKSWCNMDDLFKAGIADKEMTLHHPKVMAMKSGLEKCRPRIDVAPESIITVKLPMKVQTALSTYTKIGIARDDGLLIVMAEFSGYVKDFHKKVADAGIVFNK